MIRTVVIAGALLALGVARWRAAVVAALFLAVFEGALRKWIFPELSQVVYLATDLLLFGAYLGFFGRRLVRDEPLFERHPANAALGALVLLVVLELFNPTLPNLWVGLFGVKAYLLYVPLLFMVPSLFPRPSSARRFVTAFLIVALVPLLLGPVQFWSPPDSVINRYAWDEEFLQGIEEGIPTATGYLGTLVRVTGTFSYISTYAVYLLLLVPLALAWGLWEHRTWFRRAAYGILTLALLNLLMTGSRGPLLILGGTIPLLLVLARRAPWGARPAPVIALGALLLFGGLIGIAVLDPETLLFLQRFETTQDLSWRIAGLAGFPLAALQDAGSFGYGVGTTHQATIFLAADVVGVVSPPPAEGELERIVLELGPLGLVLVLVVRLLVIVRLWTASRATLGTDAGPLVLTALVYCISLVPGGPVFNHTASLFYWFLAGTALIAPSPVRPEAEAPPTRKVDDDTPVEDDRISLGA